jgi:DGQHR domain-containing protein
MIKKQAKKNTTNAVKHQGSIARSLRFPAIEVNQSGKKLYLFRASAAVLFDALSINRRTENKDEGYQRVLSQSRVESIARYIQQKRTIPGAITVCFDNGVFSSAKREISVPAGKDIGWVIDGQHRLAGASMAAKRGTNIELPVVSFMGLTEEEQIEQFVTINREAKNVPTSLYLDLLKHLPTTRKPAEIAKERAVDLAHDLRKEEGSPFYERIVVTVSPRLGQLSLTNVVRKIAPLVVPEKGFLSAYTEPEQRRIVWNYYEGLRQVFPKDFESKDSVFFKTIGFGALWNVFPVFFTLALKHHQAFQVKDVAAIFKQVGSFDFNSWKQLGSGNQAEQIASDELKTYLYMAFKDEEGQAGSLRL